MKAQAREDEKKLWREHEAVHELEILEKLAETRGNNKFFCSIYLYQFK